VQESERLRSSSLKSTFLRDKFRGVRPIVSAEHHNALAAKAPESNESFRKIFPPDASQTAAGAPVGRVEADRKIVRASLRLSCRIFRKFLLGKPQKICIERRDSIRSFSCSVSSPK
jgi:hypothetical protein